MVTFKLVLGYTMRPDDKKVGITEAQVTDALIEGAYASKYPKGVSGKDNRLTLKTIATVQDAISVAIAVGKDSIELEFSAVEWIGEILTEFNCPPKFGSYYIKLTDYVNGLVAENKPKS